MRFILLLTLVFTLSFGAALSPAHEEKQPEKTGAEKPAAQLPNTGFEGRVVSDGQVIAGAVVFAYYSFADLVEMKPAYSSTLTADDGTWKLELPTGRYYLAAKKRQAGAGDGPLAVGDYFAFQGSNPITVVPGRYTHVGFSMVKLDAAPAYTDSTDAGSGSLTGVVSYGGAPLEGANVTLYLDGKNDFRGMGYSSSPPTGKDGIFRVDFLPESDYFVIVRKRANGKGAGPLTDGDYFGYYVANPVPVKAGKVAKISLGVVNKAGEIGKDDSLFRDTGTHITGRILDKNGKPVKGVYAFAYLDKVMAHKRPEYISRAVDDNGRYVLNLSQGGVFYIGSRSDYGDTPGMGEWYGRYEGTGDHSVKVKTGEVLEGVDITVEQILP